MVDTVVLAVGIAVAFGGAGLAFAASRYAREMERNAENVGPLRAVLVPPFVSKARAYTYLLWTARVAGTILALIGVLFAASGIRSGKP